jgi:hypothetical protein
MANPLHDGAFSKKKKKDNNNNWKILDKRIMTFLTSIPQCKHLEIRMMWQEEPEAKPVNRLCKHCILKNADSTQ